MKTKNIIMAGFAGIVLASCSEQIDDNVISLVNNTSTLRVLVEETAGAATRADYSGFPSTTFEEDDKIGVYAFDGSTYVTSNVRFVKQSDGSWEPDEDVPYDENYTYYAYFPYSEDVYTPSTSGTMDDVDTKFASFISDASNYFWTDDQSTKAGFTYSNLMIAKGNITDAETHTIKFTMAHKRGLAKLTGEVESFDFTGNTPYMSSGVGYFLVKPLVQTIISNGFQAYSLSIPAGDYRTKALSCNYLKFTAEEAGTFTLTIPAALNTEYFTSVSYSLDDGESWTTTVNSSNEVVVSTPPLAAGAEVLWKGIGVSLNNSCFSATGRFRASGNVMSLLNRISLNTNSAFRGLFKNCTMLTVAPELPATVLAPYCYTTMFQGCTSLTDAPKLPATTLAQNCYQGMFQGCTSLTKAPKLPATTVSYYGYATMFQGCTSLTDAPKLPATTLAQSCYNGMFQGCTSLTKAPKLAATTLAISCYQTMFQGCTSLTEAPVLSATVLAQNCYKGMFGNCSALTIAPELPATVLVNGCYSGMFQGCTSLTEAPELPAETLVTGCYSSMFSGCRSLNYIRAAFTTEPSNSYTDRWVLNVASSGTFYKNKDASWDVTGVYGVPTNWIVEIYDPDL